jgi:hypothetical protein
MTHLITFRQPNNGKCWQKGKNVEVMHSASSLTNIALVEEITVFHNESK